jgi:hypothetical protein
VVVEVVVVLVVVMVEPVVAHQLPHLQVADVVAAWIIVQVTQEVVPALVMALSNKVCLFFYKYKQYCSDYQYVCR